MNIFKKLLALSLVFMLAFSLTACGDKDDDDTVLTTKKKQSNTTTAPAIDIWAYLNENAEESVADGIEPVGTTAAKVASKSTKYSYEDVAVSSGGSDIFSSATTSKAGYPTFSWSPVAGAMKYNIYRATSSSGSYGFLASTTATTYTDKTAVSGHNYFYKVKAVVKVAQTTTTKKSTTTKKASTSTTGTISITKTTIPQTTRNVASAPATEPVHYGTVAEIVNFYNVSANQVKTDASSVSRSVRTITKIDDPNNSDTIDTLLALINTTSNTDNKTQSFSTPATIRDEFPVEGKNVSSTLTESMVSNATCTYSSGYYTVVIALKYDPEKTTDYSGTCINVFKPAKYSVSGATSETHGAQIKARIAYDGHLDLLEQYAPTWVYVDSTQNDFVANGQYALSIYEKWYVNY